MTLSHFNTEQARGQMIIRLCCTWAVQIVLYLCYKDFISPRNNYSGMVLAEIDLGQFLLWNILFSVPAIILPATWSRPGALILWYLYLITLLPLPTITLALGKGANLPIAATAFLAPFCLMLFAYRFWGNPTPFSFSVIRRSTLTSALAVICLLGSLTLVALYSSRMSLSWEGIYDRRLDTRSITGSRTAGAYLIAIFAQVIVPVTLAMALTKIDWKNAALLPAALGTIVIFSFNGTKSAVFTPLAMIIVAMCYARGKTNALLLLLFVLSLLCVAYCQDHFFEGTFLNETVIRRVLVIPAQLVNAYIEYFPSSGYLWFSDVTFFGRFVNSPYGGVSASFIIGEGYFGNPDLNANVGAIPYGFAEAGVAGAWLVCGLITILIICFERGAAGKNLTWILPLIFAVAYRFSEQALHTSLITGGVVLILLLILCVDDRLASAPPPTPK